MKRDQKQEEIIWRSIVKNDRIRIGRHIFKNEKNLSVILRNMEATFGLESLHVVNARIKNRGPDVVMKCPKKVCSGFLVRMALLKEEVADGAKIGFRCSKCGYEVLSNATLSVWIDRGSDTAFTKAREQGMLKSITPLRNNIKSFLKAEFGSEVIDKVYRARLLACGVGPVQKRCYNLKIAKRQAWCGACGCGFRKDAELYNKLKLAQVQCPLDPPRFLAINKRHKAFLKKGRWWRVFKRVYKSFINFFVDLKSGVYKKSVINYIIKKLNYIIVKLRAI